MFKMKSQQNFRTVQYFAEGNSTESPWISADFSADRNRAEFRGNSEINPPEM